MKKTVLVLLIAGLFTGLNAKAQTAQPSPDASVTETTNSGVTISIDYSSPGVKGRTIFADSLLVKPKPLQPYGVIWRAGANNITKLQVSKDVKLEGKTLPAGTYGIYTIPGEKEWTLIISKKYGVSGAAYPEGEDLFRISGLKPKKVPFTERLVYKISKEGVVSLIWENTQVDFAIK